MVTEITGAVVARNLGLSALCGVASGVGTMVGAVLVLAAVKAMKPELLGGIPKKKEEKK